MIQTRHCDFCEFPKRNLESGLTCGLTDKKPDFKVSCSKIKFNSSFKEYLPELLNQIGNVKKRKTSVYLKFILLSLIGLTVIFKCHSLLDKIFEMEFGYSSWIYFKYTLLVYFVGAGLISMAFWPLLKYRNELKELESDKREINKILKNYDLNIESLLKNKKRHHNIV